MCQVQFEQAGAVSRWLSLPAGIGSPYCLTHCCPDLPSLSCRYSHSAHLLYCQLVDPQDMIGAKSLCIYSFTCLVFNLTDLVLVDHLSRFFFLSYCMCLSVFPLFLDLKRRFKLLISTVELVIMSNRHQLL
jgi:hypothetical protein